MHMRFLAPFAAVMLAACAATTSPGVPPRPAGGMVTGRLVSQKSDGSGRTAVGGTPIGVFGQAVLPGKVLQHPPSPIATAVTSHDGGFLFHGLAPGRYFITVAANGPVVTGQWVTLVPGHGASVLLIHCTNCPTPL
jgi:hypothetical protein